MLSIFAFVFLLNEKIVKTRFFLFLKNTFTATFFFNFFLYFLIPLFTIAIIVLILIIRYYVKKGIRNQLETVKIQEKVDIFLSKVIFGDKLSIEDLLHEIDNFKKTIPFKDNYVKKIILDKIINVSEVFKLDNDDILVILFHEFEFLNYSQKLISKRKWYIKALGIYFLEKINYKTELRLIEPFLNDKNEKLRSLSFIAILNLKDDVFELLSNYKETISFASKIKIAEILNKKNTTFSIEEVSKLLKHENDSIKSVAMLYVLKKSINVDKEIIVNLLDSKNQHIRKDIVILIRDLKLSDLESQLFRRYQIEEIIRIKISIFKTLAEIGSEKSVFFALKIIEDVAIDPAIEFEAVRTIYKLNPVFFEQFIISKFSEKDTVKKIIAHINSPFLS